MGHHMPKSLAQLLAGAGDSSVTGDPDVAITSIAVDSRRAQPGSLFFCLRGSRSDGHDHIAAAIAAGASAVVVDRQVPAHGGVPIVTVPDSLAALSHVSAAFFDHPSRKLIVVGVTGTNGKTTTTHFIEAISHAAGSPFGLIGTLGARLRGDFEEQLEHTTPFAHDVQRLLARFRDGGASGAVLEVSSHALALHRVDDVSFDAATFTNLTQDHLDFHSSLDEYRAAKAKLFELTGLGRAKSPGVAIVNADDPEGAELTRSVKRRITFGMRDTSAQLHADDIQYQPAGTTFTVKALRPAPFTIQLPGPFNVSNAMAALATAVALDIDVEAIAEGLASVREVPGRMTAVSIGDVAIFVDYAHTPDGLAKVLEAARALTAGKLICVFGCGGDRDPIKRPIMGRIARASSDFAIVTSDNPRFEDPDRIIADIVAGMRDADGAPFEVEPDRATAIERAIASARPGDVVVIAGKGHETYQSVRGEKLPFSDAAAVRAVLAKVGA
jgi:UDP-N-acetylmuramoyl-L-alanyl-D-glutamate--2,6-diaminopimelate ligase